MRLLICVMASAILASSPAHAGEPQQSTDSEKLICKREKEKTFGSNFIGRKDCRTAQEWKELEANAKRQLQAFKDKYNDPGRAEGR